jgi:hypothetical protein
MSKRSTTSAPSGRPRYYDLTLEFERADTLAEHLADRLLALSEKPAAANAGDELYALSQMAGVLRRKLRRVSEQAAAWLKAGAGA